MEVTVSVKESGAVSRNIDITIPRNLFTERFNAAVRRAANQARIKGFRPGKAPHAVVSKMYGSQIHADVLSEFIEKACRDVVQEKKLKVVGGFSIQDVKSEEPDDLQVTAEVSLLPEPKIKDYFGVKAEVQLNKFKDEDIEGEIEKIREAFADRAPIESRKVAEKDDVVCVDYQAYVDGDMPKDGQRTDEYVQLDAERLQKEIVDGLIGAEVGSTKEIVITHEHDEEHDGHEKGHTHEYRYVFTIKGLFEKKLPELNDELAKKSGIADTVDEMKKKLTEQFEAEVEKHNRSAKESSMFDAILESNEFEVPQVMVDEQIRGMLKQMGYLRGSDEKVAGIDMAPFRESFGHAASKQIKRSIALERIIEQEKVGVTDADLDSWAEKRAAEFGTEPDKLRAMISSRAEDKSYFTGMVARQKMIDLLLEKTSFSEKKADSEDKTEKAEKKTSGRKTTKKK